jgi:dTDP-4-dehydrorhamnose 3,5-epimerase-like enzyme
MSNIDLVEVIPRKFITDSRGSFLKLMNGSEPGLKNEFGEIYTVKGYPGESRANHYHLAANEWFTLLSGAAVLRLQDIETGVRRELWLDANDPVTVRVPSMVAHSFENSSDIEFMLLAYSDSRYDANDTVGFSFK